MSLYIYLLSALFGMGSIVFLFIKQRSENIEFKEMSLNGKVLFIILITLTLNSILFFFNINDIFIKSWISLTLTVFLDLLIFVLFYFYILVKINIIQKIKGIHILHFIVPILFLFFLSHFFSGIQNELSFIKNFEKIKINKNKLQVLKNRNMIRKSRFENRFIKSPEKQRNLKSLAFNSIDLVFFLNTGYNIGLSSFKSYNQFNRDTRENKNNLFIYSLLFKWIYFLLMLGNIIFIFKKNNNNRIDKVKEDLIWITVLLTTICMSLFIWTNIFISKLPFNGHLAFIRLFKSFPIVIFYTFLIGVYLFTNKITRFKVKKYGKNLITISELNRHYNILITYMKKQKPYHDEALTLKQLADDININANDLSQIINKKKGCNFRDFINSFRVEEVKYKLLNNRKKNILSIAMDAGFNSKSGFNLAFKKYTNLTPSEFIKINKNNINNEYKSENNVFLDNIDFLYAVKQKN